MPSFTTCFDPIHELPSRARRAAGRFHQPAFALTDGGHAIARQVYGAFAAVRSVAPEPIVTFNRKRSTFIFLSAKTGTTQEGEGPWEYALAKELEVNPFCADYQMHGSQLSFEADDGNVRKYGPDVVYWSFDTGLTMAEVKANAVWFGLPEVRAMSDRAADGLADLDIAFAEVCGDELRADRRRAYNVSRAFADRTTQFSPAQREAVRNRIAEHGPVPLGDLARTLDVPRPAVLQTVNAMMVRRDVAYDLASMVDDDTAVVLPPRAPADMPDIRRIGR